MRRPLLPYIVIALCIVAGVLNVAIGRVWAAALLALGVAGNVVLLARGIRLRRQLARAEARRAELEQLELELHAATERGDVEARVRLLERLCSYETLQALVLVSLVGVGAGGCAGPVAELEHDAGGDVHSEVDPPPTSDSDAAELEHDAGDAGADVDWLALVHPHCAGAWADRDDSSTRFVAHPDTQLCTFPCRWLEPKCGEPWYGDPRCFPAHEQRLEQVCAELGGSCELASDGERYCEAAP